jgi:hypothetical protein
MIPLSQLEAKFIALTEVGHREVATIEEAQGVQFLCPKCFTANGGAVGTHGIICWSRSKGVPDEMHPKPGRWSLHGTSLDDLYLHGDLAAGGGARSVLLTSGCGWHGFIDDGHAVGDC